MRLVDLQPSWACLYPVDVTHEHSSLTVPYLCLILAQISVFGMAVLVDATGDH